jgi:hypothetical protein
MSVYDSLRDYLMGVRPQEVVLTFAEIEKIISRSLPKTAMTHDAWWGNQLDTSAHTQCRSWQGAGFHAFPAIRFKRVKFVRKK